MDFTGETARETGYLCRLIAIQQQATKGDPMASILHNLRWLGAVLKDLVLRPKYKPQEFWAQKHKVDSFEAVGRRRLGEAGNARWYAEMEADFLDEITCQHLDLSQVSVLEIGPGTGYWTAVVQRLGCKDYLGIDIAEAAVERLRTKFPAYRFKTGDAASGDVEGHWDVIIMIHVDEHIHGENFTQAMFEIKDALRPGGQLLVTAYHPKAKGHVPHVEYHSETDFACVFPA